MSLRNSLCFMSVMLLVATPVFATGTAPTATPSTRTPHTHVASTQLHSTRTPARTSPARPAAHARADHADQVYSKEVEEYQRAAMLNDARVRYFKSLAELRKLEEKANGPAPASSQPAAKGSHPPVPTRGASPAPHVSAAEKALRDLTIVSVWGTRGHYKTKIFYRAGGIEAGRGDLLPGGWTIVSIQPYRVLVRHGKHGRLHELSFESPQVIRRKLGLGTSNMYERNPVAMPITAPPSMSQIQ